MKFLYFLIIISKCHKINLEKSQDFVFNPWEWDPDRLESPISHRLWVIIDNNFRAENKNYVPVESLLDEGLKLNSIEKMQTLGRKKPAGQRLYFNYLSKLKGWILTSSNRYKIIILLSIIMITLKETINSSYW